MSSLSDFRVLEHIGRGSFGSVSKVFRYEDQQVYVMKQINISTLNEKEQLEAVHEVHVMAAMDSPFVVRYYDSFIDDGKLCIIMEYCEKGDLQKVLKAQKGVPLPENLVWVYFLQILLGVAYLHGRRTLHRDLKTANCFLTADNSVKIGDLGVARILGTESHFARTLCGTPYYLSPELCENKPYNEKSDVWACGVILYELITGKHPFDARNQGALVYKILSGKFPPIQVPCSPVLMNLVNTLLTRETNKRPTIIEILADPLIYTQIQRLQLPVPPQLERIMESRAGRRVASEFVGQPSGSLHSLHEEKELETSTEMVHHRDRFGYKIPEHSSSFGDDMASREHNRPRTSSSHGTRQVSSPQQAHVQNRVNVQVSPVVQVRRPETVSSSPQMNRTAHRHLSPVVHGHTIHTPSGRDHDHVHATDIGEIKSNPLPTYSALTRVKSTSHIESSTQNMSYSPYSIARSPCIGESSSVHRIAGSKSREHSPSTLEYPYRVERLQSQKNAHQNINYDICDPHDSTLIGGKDQILLEKPISALRNACDAYPVVDDFNRHLHAGADRSITEHYYSAVASLEQDESPAPEFIDSSLLTDHDGIGDENPYWDSPVEAPYFSSPTANRRHSASPYAMPRRTPQSVYKETPSSERRWSDDVNEQQDDYLDEDEQHEGYAETLETGRHMDAHKFPIPTSKTSRMVDRRVPSNPFSPHNRHGNDGNGHFSENALSESLYTLETDSLYPSETVSNGTLVALTKLAQVAESKDPAKEQQSRAQALAQPKRATAPRLHSTSTTESTKQDPLSHPLTKDKPRSRSRLATRMSDDIATNSGAAPTPVAFGTTVNTQAVGGRGYQVPRNTAARSQSRVRRPHASATTNTGSIASGTARSPPKRVFPLSDEAKRAAEQAKMRHAAGPKSVFVKREKSPVIPSRASKSSEPFNTPAKRAETQWKDAYRHDSTLPDTKTMERVHEIGTLSLPDGDNSTDIGVFPMLLRENAFHVVKTQDNSTGNREMDSANALDSKSTRSFFQASMNKPQQYMRPSVSLLQATAERILNSNSVIEEGVEASTREVVDEANEAHSQSHEKSLVKNDQSQELCISTKTELEIDSLSSSANQPDSCRGSRPFGDEDISGKEEADESIEQDEQEYHNSISQSETHVNEIQSLDKEESVAENKANDTQGAQANENEDTDVVGYTSTHTELDLLEDDTKSLGEMTDLEVLYKERDSLAMQALELQYQIKEMIPHDKKKQALELLKSRASLAAKGSSSERDSPAAPIQAPTLPPNAYFLLYKFDYIQSKLEEIDEEIAVLKG